MSPRLKLPSPLPLRIPSLRTRAGKVGGGGNIKTSRIPPTRPPELKRQRSVAERRKT